MSVCTRKPKVAGKTDARALPVQTEAPQRFSSELSGGGPVSALC